MTTSRDYHDPHADQFEATLHWTGGDALLPGRLYRLRIGAQDVAAAFAQPKYKQGATPGDHLAARQLKRGEVGVCNLSLAETVNFLADDATPGSHDFTLFDPASAEQVGHGSLHFALRRAHNIQWQTLEVSRAARAAIKQQRPRI